MSEERKDQLNGIIQKDAERKREKKKLHKEITFREYLGLVAEDSAIAQLSASRLWEIIQNAGVVNLPEEEQWMGVSTGYNLFRNELYGVDKPIFESVEHIKVGATRGSTGKYLLILVGPPSAGKSTWVRILAKALENYNLRSVFCIKGCPKPEEPLHLLPRYMRDEVAKKKKKFESIFQNQKTQKIFF